MMTHDQDRNRAMELVEATIAEGGRRDVTPAMLGSAMLDRALQMLVRAGGQAATLNALAAAFAAIQAGAYGTDQPVTVDADTLRDMPEAGSA